MKEKLLISFSGGRTSAYMAQWLLNNVIDKYEIIVVFSNTGEEDEATLEFVKKCDEYFRFNTIWIEAITNPKYGKGVSARIVDFKTADRTGLPFRNMIEKHGIPNQSTPHCSRELKKYAIRAYARQIGWKKYYTAIGIRNDEVDRISLVREKERLIYPLISLHPTNRQQINKFWLSMSFDLQIKSYEGNCKVCWKKSLRKLLTIARERPEWFEKFSEWEKEFENYTPPVRLNKMKERGVKPVLPNRFFRGKLSVNDILEMSKNDFEPVRDESKDVDEYVQTRLFGHELDLSDGCVESCEVF